MNKYIKLTKIKVLCYKIEDGKLYIPPFSYLRDFMQRKSAYDGLDDPHVFAYCQAFFKLALSFTPPHRKKLLKPISTMLSKGKTVSDEILALAKKRRHIPGGELDAETAREIAIRHSIG